jgi:hypothetical protein
VEAAATYKDPGGPIAETIVEPVMHIIEGFEAPYGVELLASKHWVVDHEDAGDPHTAAKAVRHWTNRSARSSRIAMSQRRLITCKKSMPRCRKVATPKAPARIAGSELAGRVTRVTAGRPNGTSAAATSAVPARRVQNSRMNRCTRRSRARED